MKRILPLVLIVLLLPALLAVPARADEIDNSGWLNVLDYGYEVFGDDNVMTLEPSGENTRYTFRYDLPEVFSIYAVDLIIQTDATNFTFANNGDNSAQYTVISLGDGLYRVFGNVNRTLERLYFYMFYSDGSYVKILSLRASTVRYSVYNIPVTGEIHQVSYNESETYTSSIYKLADDNPSNTVSLAYYSNQSYTFYAHLDIADWNAFDYVHLEFTTYCSSLESIQVQHNGVPVPVETSITLDNDSSGVSSLFVVDLIIDVSQLPRDSNMPIWVNVFGSLVPSGYRNFVIQRAHGLVDVGEPSLWTYWSMQLNSWISNQTDAISSLIETQTTYIRTWGRNIVDALGGSNDGSQVQDNINAAVGELQQAGAALDAVDRPDIGQVNIDVAGMVDPVGLTGVAAIVGLFTGNSLIYTIMLMFVTLALISYILYGKG